MCRISGKEWEERETSNIPSEWTAAAAADRKARTLTHGNGCLKMMMHHATGGHMHL
jgi:hypothetical protein